MSGVDAGGNWAASGDGVLELRKLASRARARMTAYFEAVDAPVHALTLATQRLYWAMGLKNPQSCTGCFGCVEATGLLVHLTSVPGSLVISRLWVEGDSAEHAPPVDRGQTKSGPG